MMLGVRAQSKKQSSISFEARSWEMSFLSQDIR